MPMLPQAPNPSLAIAGREAGAQEFSQEERAWLLRLAHDSILSGLQLDKFFLDPPPPHLAQARGALTSLYLRGELRGCVGYVMPALPLYRTVAESARAAAYEDRRFAPVTREESSELEIELSILSPPKPIPPEGIEIGRHGLLIDQGGRRGLLLPQVAVEHNWDRVTFLEQTCRKAGLPVDAWLKGATVRSFTAEVFGEKAH
jgi:AmmeMemoRadiSam system protein A